jgi:DNA replication protein DnaC
VILDTIFAAFDEGSPALLVTGRSLYDLVIDREKRMRPLVEALRIDARRERGMHLVSYSMASGLDWDDARIGESKDRDTIAQALRSHRLLDIPQDQNEVVRVLRGISSLARSQRQEIRWADGKPLKFLFLCEFGEHLAPGTLTNGTQSETQLVAIELAHVTAQSLALRSSGHLVILHARDGLVDPLVCSALRHVRLRQPDETEKRQFIDACLSLYTAARLEPTAGPEIAARLSSNTPNRGLEQLLRASHHTKRALPGSSIAAQKSQDIEALSERTLTVLDSSRVAGLDLRGRNIGTPRRVLQQVAAALRRGDRSVPSNILLAGGPGTGKTDLAILTAVEAGVAAYEMHSPKSAYVGETERRARLQQAMLDETTPCLAFCDEISEALPLERSSFDGDSGASRAVMATLLTALSDETRRGCSIIIGSTNCPWRIGEAMRSRFVVLPVLQPLREDMPAIVVSTARRVAAGVEVDAAHPAVQEAGGIFYDKGASARDIRQALSTAAMLNGKLGTDQILLAAHDLIGRSDRTSAVYADLWAVRACSSRAFLPWAENPQAYPYPPYLADVVDTQTGEPNSEALDRKLAQLRPQANV